MGMLSAGSWKRQSTEEQDAAAAAAARAIAVRNVVPKVIEQDAPLLKLPSEIIHQILTNLTCPALVSLSGTCRQLRSLSISDILWANLLRPHIPEDDFPTDPYPSSSFRNLYIAHHPYWFLPQHRLWISDEPHVGRVMLCKYDPRRGCIEGYRLLADRGPSMGLVWPHRPSVIIHTFAPRVHLWLDDPILKLPHDIVPFNTKQGWWEGEIKMHVGRPGNNVLASFFLSRNISDTGIHPGTEVWPPKTIPDMPRVRTASNNRFRNKEHKPQTFDEISNTTFRMRQWSQFTNGWSHLGIRIGEEVSTWSTINPSLYTPTPEKPYQGIFVGDYAGHGCEFLLVMHTEQAPPPPPPPQRERDGQRSRPEDYYAELLVAAMDNDTDEEEELEEPGTHVQSPLFTIGSMPEGSAARDDESIYHGSLEAVKLTGDPNIPRGEHTFIADDIGRAGLIRIAEEHPFRGARVVKSRGHVAARGFVNDEFIPSQLIMIDHNRLAQYWVPFGHISFYERVNIDSLMDGIFHSRRTSDPGQRPK